MNVLVDHRMVKPEDDVTAIAAQTDRATAHLAAQRCLNDSIDAVLGKARTIGWRLVYKLAWGGQVVIYMGYIG